MRATMRQMRLALLILFVASVGAAQFRATSALVLAPATVTDPAGRFIDGLRARDLILYDNNVPQPIQVEEAFNPLSLMVVIQANANSAANLKKLADAGILLTQLVAGERGQTSLVAFADDLHMLSDFTASTDRLSVHLRNLSVRGRGAAALDTILESMSMLTRRASAQRRVLLVIGETRDRSSKVALDLVAQAAQRQNVLIYWLAYSPFLSELGARPGQSGRAPEKPLNILTEARQQAKPDAASELTRVTGGRVIRYLSKQSLENGLQAIGAEIHRQYLVSFRPSPTADRDYHTIRIEVKNRPELAVRTRAGYWTVE